jgi:hypothetical protein
LWYEDEKSLTGMRTRQAWLTLWQKDAEKGKG